MRALATRVADAHLREDERRTLILRERDGAGYAEIASVVGVDPREVGALLASARLSVREAVRGRPLPDVASEDCVRARPLLCARQDGERLEDGDRTFLRQHVEGCESCRSARVALREGTLALRAALGVEPPAAAAAAVPAAAVVPPAAAALAAPLPAEAVTEPAMAAAPAAPSPAPARNRPSRERAARSAPRRRRRRAPAVLAVAILASAVASMATMLLGGDEPRPSSAAQPTETSEPSASPTATPAVTNDARRAAAARRKAAAAAKARRERAAARRKRAAARRKRAAARAIAPAAPAPAATATPEPAATPRPERRDRKPARQKPADTRGNGDADTKTDNGGAVIPQQPTDNPDGKPDVIPDSCSQDNPDCDSG